MKFVSGDKVRFLNEVGQGEVLSVLSNGKVLVRTSEGFDIAFSPNELVLADISLLSERQKSETTTNKRFENKKWEPLDRYTDFQIPQLETALFFVSELLTANHNTPDFNFGLLNNTPYHLFISISKILSNQLCEPIKAYTLEPTAMGMFTTVKNQQLNELPSYRLDVVFFGKKNEQYPEPICLNFKPKAIKIITNELYKPLANYKGDFYTLKIYNPFKPSEKISLNEQSLKNQEINRPKQSKNIVPDVVEVDLHIEKLNHDYKTLSSAEILTFQLSVFRQKLEQAISNRCKKIIFIHGVGNGILRNEIHKILKEQYIDLKFRDASVLKYGYGATEVLIEF